MDIHFFNPFNAQQAKARMEFHSLTPTHQFLAAVATVFTSLAGLPFLLVGGVMLGAAVFRAIVEWRPLEQKTNNLGINNLNTKNANTDSGTTASQAILSNITAKTASIDNNQSHTSAPVVVYDRNSYSEFVLPDDLPLANYYVTFSSNDRPSPGKDYKDFMSNRNPQLPTIVVIARGTELFLDPTPRYSPEFGLDVPILQLRMIISSDPSKDHLLVKDDVYQAVVGHIKKFIRDYK